MAPNIPIVMAHIPGGRMRVIVELHRTQAGTVHGAVIAPGEADIGEPQRFAGWLELLRVLEALAPPETQTWAEAAVADRCENEPSARTNPGTRPAQ
jgi:hypothetical protein